MTTAAQQDAARRAIFSRRLGQELRQLREASGASQALVSDLFGWTRDAISKIERGKTRLGMFEYLTLMQFYRDMEPGHPAVALAKRLLPPAPNAAGRSQE